MKVVNEIIENYLNVRTGNYPFPPDSVAAFAFVLGIQSENTVSGDLLELGVEHGGTAFLLAQSLKDEEVLHLVDLKKTERFSTSYDGLSDGIKENIIFHEMPTTSRCLDGLAQKKFRLIHIDAGHTKDAVLRDATRFGSCLAPRGVTVFDDVFEIRWPGVTEAVLEYLPLSGLVPFFIVDRKLYCCDKRDHEFYFSQVKSNLSVFNVFGHSRHWIEPWCGIDTVILKLDIAQDFQKLFKRHG